MPNVVHFNMMFEINQMLKKKGVEYSIHAVGGCTCAGLKLRQDGKEYPLEKVIGLINEYLKDKWMRVVQDENDPYLLNVESMFDDKR